MVGLLIFLILFFKVFRFDFATQTPFQKTGKHLREFSKTIVRLLLLCFMQIASESAAEVISPSPQATSTEKSVRENVVITKITVTGSSIFSEKEIRDFVAPYENRSVSYEELETLRQEITKVYVTKGYVNSGILMPDQEISGGVLKMYAVEGTLKEITIDGLKQFRSSYLTARLSRGAGHPLNLLNLQEALQLLQQDTRIKRINAELKPGIIPGEGILQVKVEENRPYRMLFSFGNTQSPSTGAYKGEAVLSHLNLLGMGDILEARFGLTKGTTDYGLRYVLPINSRDTTLELRYLKTQSTVKEEPFEKLDIESRSETMGITLIHPVRRIASGELSLSASAELKKNQTYLLGIPFSFTELEDNTTRETVIRIGASFIHRTSRDVLAANVSVNWGVNALDATVSRHAADGRFLLFLGQVQWIRQLTDSGYQILLRASSQFSNDHLLPMERFAVGGFNTVRGYRENQLTRDNGLVASAEGRMPLIRNARGETVLQLAPFFDAGWSWNSKRDTPAPRSLSSIGAGIRWAVMQNMNFQLYAGHPLRKIESGHKDLQDMGIHFLLSWQVF